MNALRKKSKRNLLKSKFEIKEQLRRFSELIHAHRNERSEKNTTQANKKVAKTKAKNYVKMNYVQHIRQLYKL